MKIAIVHNEYGKFSGEEAVVRDQVDILKKNEHEVISFIRSSSEISNSRFGTAKAFCSGIYNPFAVRKFRSFLAQNRPDIVHVHNLFPLISPAVLPECKKAGIPVVMTVHNYRLICPSGLFLSGAGVCEKCSGGNEFQCILNNCEKSMPKSIGYALRNWFARIRKFYLNNVSSYAVLSHFQRRVMIENGFPESKICVVPNMCKKRLIANADETATTHKYVAYIGRISKEKGIDLILQAATQLPDIKFRLAGAGGEQYYEKAPQNIEFCGYMAENELNDFIAKSSFVIMPSVWYETFGLTAVESMLQSKPLVYSAIGGLPEVVGGCQFGRPVPPSDLSAFTDAVRDLWSDPVLVARLGKNACKRAEEIFSPEKYYLNMMMIYERLKKYE